MATKKPTYTEPEAYKSQYSDQIAAGIDKVTNREAFSYDPMKDANYQALSKVYTQQGNKAAKDTLGDAAGLNGGYGSSYAVTASQQVRNDYNQQLASQIPALEQAAYSRYKDSYDMDVANLQLLQDADDTAYGRYRDDVADGQWKYGVDYQAYRDDVSDKQWKSEFNYQKGRDAIADKQWKSEFNYMKGRDAVSDAQWKSEFNYQKGRDNVSDSQWAKEYALSKKTQASSNGNSTTGYVEKSSDNGNGFEKMWNAANDNATKPTRATSAQKAAAAKKKK